MELTERTVVELRTSVKIRTSVFLRTLVSLAYKILNLMTASNESTTGGSCWCLPVGGLKADLLQLIQMPAGYPRITGARWLAPGWSDKDADGVSLTTSLSIADAGTNLVLQSDTLAPTWVPTGTTLSTGVVVEAAVNSTHNRYQPITGLDTTIIRCVAFKVRPKERTKGRISIATAAEANGIYIDFDLTAETVTPGVYGFGVIKASGIKELPDGSYLVWVSGTQQAGTVTLYPAVWLRNNAGDVSYLGDITKGMYVDWCDVTESSFPEPHRVTTTATVSTDADICKQPSSESIVSVNEGAIRFKLTPLSEDTVNVSSGSYIDANNYALIANSDANTMRFLNVYAGAPAFVDFSYTPTLGQKMVVDMAWDDEKLYLAVYDDGDPQPEFQEAVETNPKSLGLFIEIGSLNEANVSPGEYDNTGYPIHFQTKEKAGWL